MSIYAISDLHLSFAADKPMDVFKGWENYTERLRANWNRIVRPEDTVVLPGDFSWALKTADALKDFEFLEKLPGKKLLIKGNHDLWWTTAKKLGEFFSEHNINSANIIFNNCAVAEGFAIAGTRGWAGDGAADKKILAREAGRLDASLCAAEKTGLPILVFLHYPPVCRDSVSDEILSVLKRRNIKKVYHGHIHGAGAYNLVKEYDGIEFRLISCDYIDFSPLFIA